MGHVCFSAIRSHRACPHGPDYSQFSVPERLLCVRCPKAPRLGVGARTLPPSSTVPGQLSPVGPVVTRTLGEARAL